MNAVVEKKEEPKPLELLERLSYKAPFKNFDPRSYPAFYEKHMYPGKYLNAIGIEQICDLLLNQFSPKEISILLQISQSFLLRWVQADSQREKDWEWALQQEADNLMFDARDKLAAAFVPADKQLDKAEKVANHNRLMAKGFGQKRWGQRVDQVGLGIGAGVIYNFNVALLPGQQEQIVRERERVIEGKVEENPPVAFSFDTFLGSAQGAVDLSIPREEKLSYEEAQGQESAGQTGSSD
jgi:hypothetical protein